MMKIKLKREKFIEKIKSANTHNDIAISAMLVVRIGVNAASVTKSALQNDYENLGKV
ncbi:2545_t:CDS:2 [Acaulospora colombiana]|uniref:2545_t:CDS:1 n=1 Tax=Acaulospora colombiana TaxID=27376 RepID=A0ACA9L1Y4_9GLOM|nr:2545_t:CDS:2 [Acaulospora colombiana]